MNLLLLSAFVVICIAVVESRYPYEDTYTSGDIVPPALNSRHPYDREGRYIRKPRPGAYPGGLYRRNSRYGKQRDVIPGRDNRRRYRDYDYYLPPRGLGGYKPYDRPDYDYGRQRRPQLAGPPKYFDEDELNYDGYKKDIGDVYH